MGLTKTKTVGGTKGGMALSNDFVSALSDLLNGGGIGANQPAGSNAVGGVRGVYGDILSGGAGKVGGALADILGRQQTSDVANLRSRFGATGGMSFGTPAAYAESQYRSQAAPQIATAIGGLQLQALSPLLSAYLDVFNKNTPQAQTIQQKTGLGQAISTVGSLAGAAVPFLAPGLPNPLSSGAGANLNSEISGQDLGALANRAPKFDTSGIGY